MLCCTGPCFASSVLHTAFCSDFIFDCPPRSTQNPFQTTTQEEVQRLGLGQELGCEYRYCVVLPAGDRTLKEIIDKMKIASREMGQVRGVSMQVICALGRVHADVMPLNIMRVGAGDIKLIDLDASSRIGEAVCCK